MRCHKLAILFFVCVYLLASDGFHSFVRTMGERRRLLTRQSFKQHWTKAPTVGHGLRLGMLLEAKWAWPGDCLTRCGTTTLITRAATANLDSRSVVRIKISYSYILGKQFKTKIKIVL